MFLYNQHFLIYDTFIFDSYSTIASFWLPKSQKINPPTHQNRFFFSINLFIEFFLIWTPFWEALGRRFGVSWRQKMSHCCLSIASELSLCAFLALDTFLDPLLGPIPPHLELQNLSKMLPNKKNPSQYEYRIILCIILCFHHLDVSSYIQNKGLILSFCGCIRLKLRPMDDNHELPFPALDKNAMPNAKQKALSS